MSTRALPSRLRAHSSPVETISTAPAKPGVPSGPGRGNSSIVPGCPPNVFRNSPSAGSSGMNT